MKKVLPRSSKNPQGFTLIELMIAISIVAIMAVAGLLALQQAQKSGRDARRREEIQAIATVIEAKKDPSSSTYSSISATDFPSRGSIPTDNTVQKYSILVADSIPATIPADPTNSSWTGANPADGAGSGTWATLTTGAEINGRGWWKLCAHMETGSKAFCVQSSQ